MGDNAELAGGEAGDELDQAIAGLDDAAPTGGAKSAAEGTSTADVDDPLADAPGEAKETDEAEVKGLTPEAQHALNERINKEVGKRKELETERDTFKTQVEELRGQITEMETKLRESRGGDPLDLAETEADIAREVANLNSYKKLLEGIKDGGEISGQYYEPGAVQAALVKLEAELTHKVPLARKNMEERKAAADAVKARYPSIFKDGTQANKDAVKLREEIPALKTRKDGYELIAAILLGKKAMEQARAKPPAAGAPARQAPPPPGPTRTSARPDSAQVAGKRGHERYAANLDAPNEDVADQLAAFLEQNDIKPVNTTS